MNMMIIRSRSSQNALPARKIHLPATTENSTHFVLRRHVDALLYAELKQSDLVDVLTYGAPGIELWSTFRVSTLTVPRYISNLVIALHRVETYHESIEDLYRYAYPDACQCISFLVLSRRAYAHSARHPARIIHPRTANSKQTSV